MQGMKANAATFGIIDWARQQMIYVDQQPGEHQGVVLQPGFLVESGCKWQWH